MCYISAIINILIRSVTNGNHLNNPINIRFPRAQAKFMCESYLNIVTCNGSENQHFLSLYRAGKTKKHTFFNI